MIMTRMVDDRQTVIAMSMRVHPHYQGKGLLRDVVKHLCMYDATHTFASNVRSK